MIDVILYTKDGCKLCDDVITQLDVLRDKYPHTLYQVDIDTKPSLTRKYGEKIPILDIGAFHMEAPISEDALKITLAAAIDRSEFDQGSDITLRPPNATKKFLFKVSNWLITRYLAIITIILSLFILGSVSAPILLKFGLNNPAIAIYRFYGVSCHQLTYRSWFLFGEQTYYPRTAAEIKSPRTYSDINGYSEADNYQARKIASEYHGSEILGYKIALCQRDIAIYLGMLGFILIFVINKRQWGSIPFSIYLLVGVFPIALDGLSQMISNLAFDPGFDYLAGLQSILPYRESTPVLRTVTGLLFGFFTTWFAIPNFEDARNLIQEELELKKIKELSSK